MKILFSGFLLLLLFVADCSSALVFRGTVHRHSAAEVREFNRQQSGAANKTHRRFIPYFPREPLVFNVSIGTPKEESNGANSFQLSLETGQTGLWALNSNYAGLSPTNHAFDFNQSTTAEHLGSYQKTTEFFDLGGSLARDVVAVDTMSFKQEFGVVEILEDLFSQQINPPLLLDGVFGIGWNPSQTASDPLPSSEPIRNLFKSANIDASNQFFVLWVNGSSGSQSDLTLKSANWQLTFGEQDSANCESSYDFTYFTSYRADWPAVFFMDNVTFAGNTSDAGGQPIYVDSGSPFITIPTLIFMSIYRQVQPDYDFDLGWYTLECGKAKKIDDLVFSLNGNEYRVPAASFIVDIGLGKGQCFFALKESPPNQIDHWVFGAPWTTSFCNLFDLTNNQISFAKQKAATDVKSA